MANEIEKAIEDASRRIRVAMGRIEKEMRKTREVLEQRLPMTVQLRAEDLTQIQADTVKALECCTQGGGCKECPLINDDKCGTDLMIRALATIKQLRAKPEPRAEERFEITEDDLDMIRSIKKCSKDLCSSCQHHTEPDCINMMLKNAHDLVVRVLAEKGVDIDDL